MDGMLDDGVAAAVRAANRPKLVLAGVTTEVCATFTALTAIKEGYEVYLSTDACGGLSLAGHQYGIERVVQSGGTPVTWPAVASEIQLQWAGPGAATAGMISDLVVEFDGNWGNLVSLYATLAHQEEPASAIAAR